MRGPFTHGFPGIVRELGAPAGHVCLGFVAEQGLGDVVRCRYAAEGWTVDHASGTRISSLTVSPVSTSGTPQTVAQAVADRIFESRWKVTLRWLGRDGDIDFGVHDNGATSRMQDENGVVVPHWRNDLLWFKRGNIVGSVVRNVANRMDMWGVSEPHPHPEPAVFRSQYMPVGSSVSLISCEQLDRSSANQIGRSPITTF